MSRQKSKMYSTYQILALSNYLVKSEMYCDTKTKTKELKKNISKN